MLNLDNEVQRFITELGHISDVRSFSVAFAKLVKKFGCEFFVISGIPDGATKLTELLVVHNVPEGWVNEYLSNNYVLNDPIVQYCIESSEPFFWTDAAKAASSREAKEIMARAESHGLKNGVCFPIHNINGFEAGISLSGFPELPKATTVRALHLASIMAFNALRRIRSNHSLRIQAISEREKEVLLWCALGKTSKEIGYILFLSENTVNVHVKNAITKLSAKNKTEAVAIAMRDGLIKL
jgi:LuxR family quorum sensing-dependent transcriptional regulator